MSDAIRMMLDSLNYSISFERIEHKYNVEKLAFDPFNLDDGIKFEFENCRWRYYDNNLFINDVYIANEDGGEITTEIENTLNFIELRQLEEDEKEKMYIESMIEPEIEKITQLFSVEKITIIIKIIFLMVNEITIFSNYFKFTESRFQDEVLYNEQYLDEEYEHLQNSLENKK